MSFVFHSSKSFGSSPLRVKMQISRSCHMAPITIAELMPYNHTQNKCFALEMLKVDSSAVRVRGLAVTWKPNYDNRL